MKKKRYLLKKLFGAPPSSQGAPTLWIHAVSVGEIRAAQPLFNALKKAYPSFFFLITTTTATGQQEAKRSLTGADAYAFLPLDFGWNVRRWISRLNVQFFFLIETDFWPSLLRELQKAQAKIILVSGKMSERSYRRFLFFSSFSKRLFSRFDYLFVQNEEQRRRFLPFVSIPSRLQAAGNLKFDLEPLFVDVPFWRKKLSLPEKSVALVSTHAPEEELIFEQFPWEDHFLILAPRHPERFDRIADLLFKKNIPFFRWSRLDERRGGERALLIDAMGQLPIIYSLCRLTIVGGSYTDNVGGHNILEPLLYGSPVFFGPCMFNQWELVSFVLENKAGKQLSLDCLKASIQHFFDHPTEENAMRRALEPLRARRGAVVRKILSLIEKK